MAQNTPPSNARRERQAVVATAAHPHQPRDVYNGRRWWLPKDTPIEHDMQTTCEGSGWHTTLPSNPRCGQRTEVVAAKVHPHRTRDVDDGRRWWLAHHTPIESEARTTGRGGGCQSTPPSNLRCGRWAEVVVGTPHTHRTRDADNGRRWWLPKYTPIEPETQTMGRGGGWHTAPPSNVRRK